MSPDERRAAILASTVPLLRERGVDITTRELAEAAGVAEGTLFRVFPDKNELVRAAIEQALDPALVVAELTALGEDRAREHATELERLLERVTEILLARARGVVELFILAHRLQGAAGRGGHHGPHGHPKDGTSPLDPIVEAVAEVLEGHRTQLRWPPRECAQILSTLVLVSVRPGPANPGPGRTAPQIVSFMLDGVRNRTEES